MEQVLQYGLNNPWAAIGVERGATLDAVRRAARQMSLTIHPDKSSHPRATEAMGLLSEHAYSLLQVQLLPGRSHRGRPARLVQLRNPWGGFEWDGRFSDNAFLLLQGQTPMKFIPFPEKTDELHKLKTTLCIEHLAQPC